MSFWKPTRRAALLAGASAFAAQHVIAPARANTGAVSSAPVAPVSDEEALDIAREAYVYLYPLITMDVSRLQAINSDPETTVIGSPANTFNHLRAYPDANLRAVVRPNFDTLYSSAWVDLTSGPVIISTADTNGRYFLLPLLDMWTDVFAVPGKRTNGTGEAHFAIVPPGWVGDLPDGVERIDAPTSFVWVLGRTQANGPADYPMVHKVQDGYKLTLLEDWGGTPRRVQNAIDPSVDTETEPLKIVNEMPAVEFFKYGAELMVLNPPHTSDWSILARMRRIGMTPGHFDASKVDASILAEASASGLQLLVEQFPKLGRLANGWQMNTTSMGVYGNYYLKRAIVAMVGLGANQPDDAIYPVAIADADGDPILAERNYVLRFEKDELPPVNAFWSLTMYDAAGFQVANPINRFAIGDRDALEYNPDGSLDLYIQHASPGAERAANWLPAPASGPLGLTLRLYAPAAEALDGRWNPPAIRKA